MHRIRTLLGGVAAAAMLVGSAQAAALYSNDFDSGENFGAGVSGGLVMATETAAAGAWNAAGWSGNYGVNRSTGNPATFSTLTLNNLATHTTVSASFLLGFLESWDGNACCFPRGDNLEIWADGNLLYGTLTANNAQGNEDYGGGTELFDSAQINSNTFFSDTLVDMSSAGFLTFAHTASTLTLQIRAAGVGWQGGADEAWGIDDIVLTYDGRVTGSIPEPATWALMIGGFGLAGAMLRRRRTAIA